MFLENIFMSAFIDAWSLVDVVFYATIVGMWSKVYMRLLEPGEIFSMVPNIVNKAISFGRHSAKVYWKKNAIQYSICKWTYDCPKCHAGIFAFLLYPAMMWATSGYQIVNHFAFITIAIYTAIKLNK